MVSSTSLGTSTSSDGTDVDVSLSAVRVSVTSLGVQVVHEHPEPLDRCFYKVKAPRGVRALGAVNLVPKRTARSIIMANVGIQAEVCKDELLDTREKLQAVELTEENTKSLLQSSEQHLAEVKTAYADLELKSRLQEVDMLQLQTDLNHKGKEISSLTSLLQSAQNQLTTWKSDQQAVVEKFQDQQRFLEAARADIESMSQAAAVKETLHSARQREIVSLREQLTKTQRLLNKAESKEQSILVEQLSISNELEDAKNSYNNVTKEVDKAAEFANKLFLENQLLLSNQDQHQDETACLKEDNSKLCKQLKEVITLLDASKEECGQLKKERKDIKECLVQEKLRAGELLKEFSEEIGKVSREKDELLQTCIRSSTDDIKLYLQKDATKQQSLQDERLKLVDEVNTLSTRLSATDLNVTTLKDQLEEAAKTITQLRETEEQSTTSTPQQIPTLTDDYRHDVFRDVPPKVNAPEYRPSPDINGNESTADRYDSRGFCREYPDPMDTMLYSPRLRELHDVDAFVAGIRNEYCDMSDVAFGNGGLYTNVDEHSTQLDHRSAELFIDEINNNQRYIH